MEYEIGNIRLVTQQANAARLSGTDEQLLEFCRAVIAHHETLARSDPG